MTSLSPRKPASKPEADLDAYAQMFSILGGVAARIAADAIASARAEYRALTNDGEMIDWETFLARRAAMAEIARVQDRDDAEAAYDRGYRDGSLSGRMSFVA